MTSLRPRSLRVAVALTLALAACPQAAQAQTNAPPGNSGIDQYLETVPDAGGEGRPTTRSEGGGSAQRGLDELGSDGRLLADIVRDTAPQASGGSAGRTAGAGASGGSAAGSEAGADATPESDVAGTSARSPLGTAVAAAAGQDAGGAGLGVALPLILLASLAATVAAVLARRRRADR